MCTRHMRTHFPCACPISLHAPLLCGHFNFLSPPLLCVDRVERTSARCGKFEVQNRFKADACVSSQSTAPPSLLVRVTVEVAADLEQQVVDSLLQSRLAFLKISDKESA